MIISHKYRMIFIHVHRTGGTTIANLLRAEMGHKMRCIGQHEHMRTAHRSLVEQHPDYFTFGFVRNPWDRLLSWYDLLHGQSKSGAGSGTLPEAFEHFLIELMEAEAAGSDFRLNQSDYFTDEKGNLKADKIGKFEAFEPEIREIFQSLALELYDIPKLNTTSAKNYQDAYTDTARTLVARACADDIARFGYAF